MKTKAKKGEGIKPKTCPCFECKEKFWIGDIWGGQVNDKMKDGAPIRDICDNCKKKYNYVSIQNYNK